MTQCNIHAPSALKLLTPSKRVVITMFASLEAASIAFQQDMKVGILSGMRLEIIPLVHPFLRGFLVVDDGVCGVRYYQRTALRVGVHVKMRANQLSVPADRWHA